MLKVFPDIYCYDDVMAYAAECQDDAYQRAGVDARLAMGIESPLFVSSGEFRGQHT